MHSREEKLRRDVPLIIIFHLVTDESVQPNNSSDFEDAHRVSTLLLRSLTLFRRANHINIIHTITYHVMLSCMEVHLNVTSYLFDLMYSYSVFN